MSTLFRQSQRWILIGPNFLHDSANGGVNFKSLIADFLLLGLKLKMLRPLLGIICLWGFFGVGISVDSTDEEIRLAFQRASETAKKSKDPNDCKYEATLKTLEFLSLNNTELRDGKRALDVDLDGGGYRAPYKNYNKGCTLRLIDLNKLRKFLIRKGFLMNPGSVVFTDYQHTVLRLRCSIKKNDPAVFWWSVSGLKRDQEDSESEDKQFTLQHSNYKSGGNLLNIQNPDGRLYFRRFMCHRMENENAKCSHPFYVITRPQPLVEHSLQMTEQESAIGLKSQFKFSCRLKYLSYCNPKMAEEDDKMGLLGSKECDVAEKPVPTYPQGPYTFIWDVPPTILTDRAKAKAPYECARHDAYEEDKPHQPYHVRIFLNKTVDAELKDLKIYVGEPKWKGEMNEKAYNVNGSDGLKYDTMVSSTVVLTGKANHDVHKGWYECVIIDGNGVPSTPSAGSYLGHVRYTGAVHVHVRKVEFIYVPAVLIVAILLIIVAIHWLCPPKMEYDDGQLYTKEEMVSPEEILKAEEKKALADKKLKVEDNAPPPPEKSESKLNM